MEELEPDGPPPPAPLTQSPRHPQLRLPHAPPLEPKPQPPPRPPAVSLQPELPGEPLPHLSGEADVAPIPAGSLRVGGLPRPRKSVAWRADVAYPSEPDLEETPTAWRSDIPRPPESGQDAAPAPPPVEKLPSMEKTMTKSMSHGSGAQRWSVFQRPTMLRSRTSRVVPPPPPLPPAKTAWLGAWSKISGFYNGIPQKESGTEMFYRNLRKAVSRTSVYRGTCTPEEEVTAPPRRCFGLRSAQPVLEEDLSERDWELLSQIKAATTEDMELCAERKRRTVTERVSRIELAAELEHAECRTSMATKKSLVQMSEHLEHSSKHTRPWIESGRFNMFMGSIIAFNAFVMAVEADYELDIAFADEDSGLSYLDYQAMPPELFTAFEIMFTIIFVTELLVRISYIKMRFFRDGWAMLDLACVVPSLVLLIFGNSGSLGRQLQLIRMLRLFKLARLLRLIKLFTQLHLIVMSFVKALSVIGWVVLLLVIVVFSFSIFCSMVIGLNDAVGTYSCDENDFNCQSFDKFRYFGSTMRTMLTFFQIFTLDGWATVVRPVVEQGMPLMLPIFVLFIFMTAYSLLSLLTALMCEQTMGMHRDARAENAALGFDVGDKTMLGLVKLFLAADKHGEGVVKVCDLKDTLERTQDEEMLEQLGEFYKAGDISDLFEVCEIRGKGPISFQDFLGTALRLRCDQQAKDLTAIGLWSKRQHDKSKAYLAKLAVIDEEEDRLLEDIQRLLKIEEKALGAEVLRAQSEKELVPEQHLPEQHL